MGDSLNTRQTLLQRIRHSDDEDSWSEFKHYYHKFLYHVCRRMDLNHYDSEEVVQKVLIQLWEQLPKRESMDFKSFRKWLCAVTNNNVRDFIRVKTRRTKYEVEAGQEGINQNSTPDIETIAEEEWRHFIVKQSKENVDEMFSTKVMAVFNALHEGKSLQEVAGEFDLPVSTVTVYKHRVVSAMCREVRRLEKELS